MLDSAGSVNDLSIMETHNGRIDPGVIPQNHPKKEPEKLLRGKAYDWNNKRTAPDDE